MRHIPEQTESYEDYRPRRKEYMEDYLTRIEVCRYYEAQENNDADEVARIVNLAISRQTTGATA